MIDMANEAHNDNDAGGHASVAASGGVLRGVGQLAREKAVSVTFIGGKDDGNVGMNEWSGGPNGMSIKFEKNKPMLLDPGDDKAWNSQQAAFLRHVISKARTNPYFKLSDGDDPHKGTRGRGPALVRVDLEAMTIEELRLLAGKRHVSVPALSPKPAWIDALLA